MNTHVVHGALISTDASFRESVKQVLGGAEHGVELSVEIAIACTEINAAQVEELRRVTLDLVLLDLGRDLVTGSRSRSSRTRSRVTRHSSSTCAALISVHAIA